MKMQALATPPNKAQIAGLEAFEVLAMDRIEVVTKESQSKEVWEVLKASRLVGFDTETKPTFHRGGKVRSPDLYQFATEDRAYLFPASLPGVMGVVKQLLLDEGVAKVGFDLKNDLKQIEVGFGERPRQMIDLDHEFRAMGYHQMIGASVAVALMFGKAFIKPKSVTTSNWSAYPLMERQIQYAASDAYVALRVYHELKGFKQRLQAEKVGE